MMKISKLGVVICLGSASFAYAQAPGETPADDPPETSPPPPTVTVHKPIQDPLATTRTIGFGIRATGLSGIGALPGVNYGGELAGMIRHNELFGELAVARWKPEKTYMVSESNDH